MIVTKKFPYPEINRIESETVGRKYVSPTGEILPSVTTILSNTKDVEKLKALENWKSWHGEVEAARILKESGDVGTLVHAHLEKFILGEDRPEGNNRIRKQARQLADVVIEKGLVNVSEVWGIEAMLYYPEKYAGTTDCVGIHKTNESIIDFKNARKPKKEEYIFDYKTQICAYASAHNKVYGTNIKQGVIMCICRGDTKPADFGLYQEWVIEGLEFQKHMDDWNRRVDLYHSIKD
jgi:hypothetical protein